jgi:hypothetical protein
MTEEQIESLVRDLLIGFKISVGGTITEDQAYAFEAGVRSALATIDSVSR